ncbi:hypothetical protein B0H16DRAFT_1461185 [Mycena metata]|uniref:Uncharacterized protein n=1 Tax=Mycena metata TaxID=1033252 RepID=A0AAD7IV52_9AGAR|nr:hypothetical protein B0H16DRAFT_1461185 [Mycena metata]
MTSGPVRIPSALLVCAGNYDNQLPSPLPSPLPSADQVRQRSSVGCEVRHITNASNKRALVEHREYEMDEGDGHLHNTIVRYWDRKRRGNCENKDKRASRPKAISQPKHKLAASKDNNLSLTKHVPKKLERGPSWEHCELASAGSEKIERTGNNARVANTCFRGLNNPHLKYDVAAQTTMEKGVDLTQRSRKRAGGNVMLLGMDAARSRCRYDGEGGLEGGGGSGASGQKERTGGAVVVLGEEGANEGEEGVDVVDGLHLGVGARARPSRRCRGRRRCVRWRCRGRRVRADAVEDR